MKNPNRYVWFGFPLWLIAFIASWVKMYAYPGTLKFAVEIQAVQIFVTLILAGMIGLSVLIYKNRQTKTTASVINTAILASIISMWLILLFPRSEILFFVLPVVLGAVALLPKFLQNMADMKRMVKHIPLFIGVSVLVYAVETVTLFAVVMPFYRG